MKKEFLENSAAAFETKMDDAASSETEGQVSTKDRLSGDATGLKDFGKR